MRTPTIFDYSKPGKRAFSLPEYDTPKFEISEYIDSGMVRKEPPQLPQVSEIEIIRHYTDLASRNYSVDKGIYPLGSCTMKYNPRINEKAAANKGFSELHPLTPEELSQGALQIMYELSEYLKEITGMDAATLLPAAGAHGELTGLLIMRAYFKDRGEERNIILIPDSAHGTNPASVKMAGFEPITVKSNSEGIINVSEIKKYLNEKVAALMVTNPNTLGVFEKEIIEINALLHENGSLSYTDGANLNALLGISRPGDLGFDIIQLNLHKTFSAPHGGGGPGSGPVLVKEFLKDYLPVPIVVKKGSTYSLDFSVPKTFGSIKLFWGNFAVMVKAYIYIRMLGSKGLRKTAESAILNANYLKKLLESDLCPLASPITPMHEFVLSLLPLKNQTGVRALDVAKALLDEGMHAPTMYFPLIVEEALMIEPTETESLNSLNSFASAFKKIINTALEDKEKLKEAPTKTPSRRVDEARAARNPVLRWKKE